MKGVPFCKKWNIKGRGLDPPRINSLTKDDFVFQLTIAESVVMLI